MECSDAGSTNMKSHYQFELHCIFSALALTMLVLAFALSGLPFNLNWPRLAALYWVGLAARAILLSALFYAIQFPKRAFLQIGWRYREQKARIPIFALFAIWMIYSFGPVTGVVIVLDGLILSEVLDRCRGSLNEIAKLGRQVFPPAIYLFLGLLAVFCYNDVIASLKWPGKYDGLFLSLDSMLLRGHSVSELSRFASAHFSPWQWKLTELIYYGMFGQIGAALVVIAVRDGRRLAATYVGTILTAYWLAIAIFYLWPSLGPFYLCSDHFSHFPRLLDTFVIHESALFKAKLLASPAYIAHNVIDTDYFIAFPCMHIAQPLVVLWFLRHWRRVATCLAIYDLVLIPAILLLEWHYTIDVIAGVLVAVLAIAMSGHWRAGQALNYGSIHVSEQENYPSRQRELVEV